GEISPFEMESFINSVLTTMEQGYPFDDAMGMSLNKLNSFNYRYAFTKIKENYLVKDIKKIVSDFKRVSNSLSKKVGNKTISSEELQEKYDENKEEFNQLSESTQQS